MTCALFAVVPFAEAQTEGNKSQKPEEIYKAFYLSGITTSNDANDIQTALRNMLSKARIYYVPSQGAITVRGTADEVELAQKIVTDLDRPKISYRLTYTLAESDGGKVQETQHYSFVVSAGVKSSVKQGKKVPIVVGSSSAEATSQSAQVQYMDVGLSIEASLEGFQDGLRVRTKVEESALSEDKSGVGTQDPIFKQTMLEGSSPLLKGKPVVIGSLDIPGSTRHLEVTVVAEPVR